MRFLMTTGESSRPADDALYAEMGTFVAEVSAAGQLVATGGLSPEVRRLRSRGEEMTVTDGPFTEAKESVVGFALLDCASWEEALELAKRFRRIVGDGESSIQEVFGP